MSSEESGPRSESSDANESDPASSVDSRGDGQVESSDSDAEDEEYAVEKIMKHRATSMNSSDGYDYRIKWEGIQEAYMGTSTEHELCG